MNMKTETHPLETDFLLSRVRQGNHENMEKSMLLSLVRKSAMEHIFIPMMNWVPHQMLTISSLGTLLSTILTYR